jgi:hypothetical protein
LGVRGRWPPLSECTICSDPASRSSSCREVGCAALQTIRREYAAPPHGSRPSRNVGFLPIPGSSHVLVAGLRTPHFICGWASSPSHGENRGSVPYGTPLYSIG